MTPDEILATADRLADPTAGHLPTGEAWWRQSLAHGAPGIALLHTELAAAGARPWDRVRTWMEVVAAGPITIGPQAGLFYGGGAAAFALAAVNAARPGTYTGPLAVLDSRLAEDTVRRTAGARARIDAGELPHLAEFDTLRGLAGLGRYLLRRAPANQDQTEALTAVLDYLAALTGPLVDGQDVLPGWWTRTGPGGEPDDEGFDGGHANFGLAHGIAGPLALLSLALLRGIEVPGHRAAITTISDWLNSWRTGDGDNARWPYMITRAEYREQPSQVEHSGARRRPSWCYGTAGLARTQQLAALALDDPALRATAEHALIGALTDPAQLAATVDTTICHGYAGLARIAERAAADADPPNAEHLRPLIPDLLSQSPDATTGPYSHGLLEGAAGTALAALTTGTGAPPVTGWDTCLLIA
ncbi:lanthionine synthetase C family protein [Actinacidiphila sp. DG2A-62]|uniref:lanthionine synthetase C family protein n=1 Tax=Actinacidiphila sp. DG2A-62 TaxID=3108821 RepID=UPI002DBA5016|nr:lanthionine synthetase C family protein [Actinacidiphila sp. DG2A-62]MEC3997220.1 lanthionine synthetase C family protein [Actinacidiphila sp. DG2A-62]